jgi:signal-transduction protein with cAMP-binding, CBS, and nucleotidyltransferase domain
VKLQEIMVSSVIQISPDETIAAAAKRMREQSVGCLVATVNGAVKGIITDRDLLACLELNHDPYGCAVAAHLSRPAIVLRPGEEHTTAVRVMRRRRVKRLVIAENGKLLGIVSLSDLAAVAHAEAAHMGAACEFIVDVVGAQLSQGKVKSAAAPTRTAAAVGPCLNIESEEG